MPTVRTQIHTVALERELRQSTVGSYMRLLGPLLDLELAEGLEKAPEFLASIETPTTRRATIIACRSVFGVKYKIPKVLPRQYTLQDDDTYRLALMLSPHSTRGLLMYDAGLRVGEACAITRDDLQGRWLTVDKQVNEGAGYKITDVKGVAGRIAVPQSLVPLIEQLEQPVWSPPVVRESLRRAGKKVGINLNPHQLRHAYCVRLLKNKVPLPVVQRQMRHSDISITLRVYAQFNDDNTMDYIDEL